MIETFVAVLKALQDILDVLLAGVAICIVLVTIVSLTKRSILGFLIVCALLLAAVLFGGALT